MTLNNESRLEKGKLISSVNSEFIGFTGDPGIYKLLLDTGRFPDRNVEHYDCKARAVQGAYLLYKIFGELPQIYNVGFDDKDASRTYQTYLVFRDRSYCYPITWHNRDFPELSLQELKEKSHTGDLTRQLFADIWQQIVRDKKIMFFADVSQFKGEQIKVYSNKALENAESEINELLKVSMDIVVLAAKRDNIPTYKQHVLRVLRAKYRNKFGLTKIDEES